MTEIVDFTKKLREKKLSDAEDASVGEAIEWTPKDAIEYAGQQCESEEVFAALIVWHSRPEGMGEDDAVVKYAIAGMDRGDLLATLVHILKRLIDDWF